MTRLLLSVMSFCIISNLSAQSTIPYPEEYVIQQKAKVMKDANGAFKNPGKFEDVNMLWVISDRGIGIYPGADKGGFGTLTGGFINLKKLKPRPGFKRELAVEDIDEKPNDQPTPVHISIKRQASKLPYQLIVEFPTHITFYNAFQRDMFGTRID
jgi:hypothetical protein